MSKDPINTSGVELNGFSKCASNVSPCSRTERIEALIMQEKQGAAPEFPQNSMMHGFGHDIQEEEDGIEHKLSRTERIEAMVEQQDGIEHKLSRTERIEAMVKQQDYNDTSVHFTLSR